MSSFWAVQEQMTRQREDSGAAPAAPELRPPDFSEAEVVDFLGAAIQSLSGLARVSAIQKGRAKMQEKWRERQNLTHVRQSVPERQMLRPQPVLVAASPEEADAAEGSLPSPGEPSSADTPDLWKEFRQSRHGFEVDESSTHGLKSHERDKRKAELAKKYGGHAARFFLSQEAWQNVIFQHVTCWLEHSDNLGFFFKFALKAEEKGQDFPLKPHWNSSFFNFSVQIIIKEAEKHVLDDDFDPEPLLLVLSELCKRPGFEVQWVQRACKAYFTFLDKQKEDSEEALFFGVWAWDRWGCTIKTRLGAISKKHGHEKLELVPIKEPVFLGIHTDYEALIQEMAKKLPSLAGSSSTPA